MSETNKMSKALMAALVLGFGKGRPEAAGIAAAVKAEMPGARVVAMDFLRETAADVSGYDGEGNATPAFQAECAAAAARIAAKRAARGL